MSDLLLPFLILGMVSVGVIGTMLLSAMRERREERNSRPKIFKPRTHIQNPDAHLGRTGTE